MNTEKRGVIHLIKIDVHWITVHQSIMNTEKRGDYIIAARGCNVHRRYVTTWYIDIRSCRDM